MCAKKKRGAGPKHGIDSHHVTGPRIGLVSNSADKHLGGLIRPFEDRKLADRGGGTKYVQYNLAIPNIYIYFQYSVYRDFRFSQINTCTNYIIYTQIYIILTNSFAVSPLFYEPDRPSVANSFQEAWYRYDRSQEAGKWRNAEA